MRPSCCLESQRLLAAPCFCSAGPRRRTGIMTDRLEKIRHVVLDMDGTIYLGHRLFPETLPFLATLRELGVGYSFVTNNCSRSRAEYASHLREMGIEAPPDS